MRERLNIYVDLSGSVAFNPPLIERMLERADRFATEYDTSTLWGYSMEVWQIKSSADFNRGGGGTSVNQAYGHAKCQHGDALIITDNGKHTGFPLLPVIPEHTPCLFVDDPPSDPGKRMWLLAIPPERT